MYIKELSKGIKIKGFKKNGLTWLCQCDPFVYMFRIDPGKYCDKNVLKFFYYLKKEKKIKKPYFWLLTQLRNDGARQPNTPYQV